MAHEPRAAVTAGGGGTSPRHLRASQRPFEFEQAGLPRPENLAVVVHTRTYRTLEVISGLVRHGFTTIERVYDEAAVALVQQLQPALVVAVVDPQRSTDLEAIRALAGRSGAFLLLLAPTPESFAAALGAGADACLCDGDGPQALAAQFGSVRRRTAAAAPDHPDGSRIVVGELVIDLDSRRVTHAGHRVSIAPMEFAVLAALAANPGHVMSPGEILHTATGLPHTDADAAQKLKVYIRRIRQKLELSGVDGGIIVSVRGFGYMLERRESTRPMAVLVD